MKQWLAERGVHYLFLLFSAVLGVAVAVVSVWADGAQGADKRQWALIAGVSAFGVVLITHFEKRLVEKGKKRAEDRAIRAEAGMAQLYTTTLRPLSDKIKAMAEFYADAAPLPSSLPAQTVADLDDRRKDILDQVLAGAVDLTAPPLGPSYLPARGAVSTCTTPPRAVSRWRPRFPGTGRPGPSSTRSARRT